MSLPSGSKIELVYVISIDEQHSFRYEFADKCNRLQLEIKDRDCGEPWAELDYRQCPGCTLKRTEHLYCPIAFNLGDLLKDWKDVVSFTQVELSVDTPNRSIRAKTTAQKALSSLFGLIMATSDCPHTQFFRPMAQFHLPLATSKETSFRAISTYLLTQFFRKQAGENVDFNLSGLSKIYENIHELNISVKKRLEDAVEFDAALNAVTVLDIFTITSTNFLDDEIENLKPLFSVLPNL